MNTSTKVHLKWYQRRTLDAGKTHVEDALADGFHLIQALRPQAKETCAKLCEKCPEKIAVDDKKRETINEQFTNKHKHGP